MKDLTDLNGLHYSLVDPVPPTQVDTTVNGDVKNDGAAPSLTSNGNNDTPMETADVNFGNDVTFVAALDEAVEAIGAVIDREGEENVIDMLEAAGMNRPNLMRILFVRG